MLLCSLTDEGSYKVIKPVGFAKMWPTINESNCNKINDENIKVGYYSYHSYYKMMNKLGFADILNAEAKSYYSTKESNFNTYSWHSEELIIRSELGEEQKELH